jgi:O-methyltransferase
LSTGPADSKEGGSTAVPVKSVTAGPDDEPEVGPPIAAPEPDASSAPEGEPVEQALRALADEITHTRQELARILEERVLQQQRQAALRAAEFDKRLRMVKDVFREVRDVHDILLEVSSAALAIRNSVDSSARTAAGSLDRLTRLESRLTHVQARLEHHLEREEEHAAAERSIAEPGFEEFFALAKPIVASGRTLLDYGRLHVLWQAAMNAAGLGLPAVEVGAYRGGSAFFLASTMRRAAGAEVPLHVFDTFAGHVNGQLSEHDTSHHARDVFADTDAEDVASYLRSEFEHVQLHVGDAVEQVENLESEHFGLVHLDVDLYRPTLSCLRYFGPRLATGGAIVVDDFGASKCPGIARAVAEYMAEGAPGVSRWTVGTEQALLVRVQAAAEG